MNIKLIFSMFLSLALTACSPKSDTEKTIYVDSSCTAFQPITTHNKDYEVMDVRTIRQINAHNAIWVKLCGEPK